MGPGVGGEGRGEEGELEPNGVLRDINSTTASMDVEQQCGNRRRRDTVRGGIIVFIIFYFVLFHRSLIFCQGGATTLNESIVSEPINKISFAYLYFPSLSRIHSLESMICAERLSIIKWR